MSAKNDQPPRRVDVRRWQAKIADELSDSKIALYSKVQALERAVTRVQNIFADLAIAGVKLGGLALPKIDAGEAERSFKALKESGVIDASLCGRLVDAQKTRNRIEHDYDKVTAGQLHDVAEDVRDLSRDFPRRFRPWIEPQL